MPTAQVFKYKLHFVIILQSARRCPRTLKGQSQVTWIFSCPGSKLFFQYGDDGRCKEVDALLDVTTLHVAELEIAVLCNHASSVGHLGSGWAFERLSARLTVNVGPTQTSFLLNLKAALGITIIMQIYQGKMNNAFLVNS